MATTTSGFCSRLRYNRLRAAIIAVSFTDLLLSLHLQLYLCEALMIDFLLTEKPFSLLANPQDTADRVRAKPIRWQVRRDETLADVRGT